MKILCATLCASAATAGSALAWSPPIQLIPQAVGHRTVKLLYSNASSTSVIVFRDGYVVAFLPNVPGPPSDVASLGRQPLGKHYYTVCEPSGRCSNTSPATIT